MEGTPIQLSSTTTYTRTELSTRISAQQELLRRAGIGLTDARPFDFGRTGKTHHGWLKMEATNPTGSFKERGAYCSVCDAIANGYQIGVCASTGNHGLGCATAGSRAGAGTRRGLRIVVFVPNTTPESKIKAIRQEGAEIRVTGASFEEARVAAEAFVAANDNACFLHPYDALPTIFGQATIGWEMINYNNVDYDTIVVPVGGGGLISGIALAHAVGSARNVRIVGACAKAAPGASRSKAAGRRVGVKASPTIADGIKVEKIGEIPWAVINRFVSDIVTVPEADIKTAMRVLHRREGVCAEGAGATALAAVLNGSVKATKPMVVISGGNISRAKFNEAVKGHVRTGLDH